ncbi:MAG: hypothetical protein IAE79_24160 [Anaerolinea sp.]|nr:hypothetical protein [Anaerolinea sp.]
MACGARPGASSEFAEWVGATAVSSRLSGAAWVWRRWAVTAVLPQPRCAGRAASRSGKTAAAPPAAMLSVVSGKTAVFASFAAQTACPSGKGETAVLRPFCPISSPGRGTP